MGKFQGNCDCQRSLCNKHCKSTTQFHISKYFRLFFLYILSLNCKLVYKTLKTIIMHMSAKLKIILLFVGLVSLISAKLPLQDKFKNLKVLPKDISEDQLFKIMDNFNHSLGVSCEFCHAKKAGTEDLDFPSDDKPEKEIARKMYTMTAAINNKYFNFTQSKDAPQAITCFTCHKGEPRPVADSIPQAPGKN